MKGLVVDKAVCKLPLYGISSAGRPIYEQCINSQPVAQFFELLHRMLDSEQRFIGHYSDLLNNNSVSLDTGPRLFLSCPMNWDAVPTWFTDLWNYSIVPYLLEAVREGIQVGFVSRLIDIFCS